MGRMIKSKLAILVMIVLMLGTSVLVSGEGYSASADSLTVLDTDVTEASDGCVMLGIEGDYFAQHQAALDYINQLRKEACEAGNVPDPRDYSRMLQPSDYVPIKWSSEIERGARIRAVEAGLAYTFMGSGHSRLNGKNIFNVVKGIRPYAECIAYNGSREMKYGINQWLAEKSTWVEHGDGPTGHYTQMIDPSNTYVGLGGFFSYYSYFPGVLVAQYSKEKTAHDETYLPVQTNVLQKIEVRDSYVDYYYVKGSETLYLDETMKVVVRVHLTNGSKTLELTIPEAITYKSSNTAAATVSADGVLTPKAKGTTVISATAGNHTIRSLTVKVDCNHNYVTQSYEKATCVKTGSASYQCSKCGDTKADILPINDNHDYEFGAADSSGYISGTCSLCHKSVTIQQPTYFSSWWWNGNTGSTRFPSGLSVGSVVQYYPTCLDGDEDFRTVVVESSNNSVIESNYDVPACVETDFVMKSAGITKLKAYLKYNPSLCITSIARVGGEGSVDISKAIVEVSSSETYSGIELKPDVKVTYEGVELVNNYDYTVSYSNNINAGTGIVTITGAGIFGGSKDVPFTIAPRSISYYSANLSNTIYEFDETVKTPSVTVKYGTTQLTEGKDYEISYKDNDKIGTATVTITGKNNFTGSINKTFYIRHTSHTYGEPVVFEASTCTATGVAIITCIYCTYAYGEDVPMKAHTSVTDAAVAPTCVMAGKTEGSHCSVCKKVLVAQKTVQALGHTVVTDKAVAPTCVKTGKTEGSHCSVCNEVLVAQKTVQALGHTVVVDKAIAATCTTTGKTEGSHCSVCNKVLVAQEVVPVKAHTYVETTVLPTFTTKGYTKHECSVCGYSYKDNYVAVLEPISLNEVMLTLPTLESFQLVANYSDLEWSSDNERVASVDENGLVTANRFGKATIKASSKDGSASASCVINTLFWDVAGSNVKGTANYQYYYDPVYWAANKGITTGNDGVNFGVNNDCTRAAVMIFLWRYNGSPAPKKNAQSYFNDLGSYSKTSATNKAIAWAYENGISKGYPDGSFGVNASIERKDVLIMLYRFAGKPSVTGSMKFNDCTAYKKGSDTYNAIIWGVAKKITAGFDDGGFHPTENCLREQIITFLYRFSKL